MPRRDESGLLSQAEHTAALKAMIEWFKTQDLKPRDALALCSDAIQWASFSMSMHENGKVDLEAEKDVREMCAGWIVRGMRYADDV